MVSRWCLGVSVSQCWSGRVRCAGFVPVVSWSFPGGVLVVLQNVQWCLGSVPVVGVPVAVVSRAVVCLGGVPVLFPKSHQVWGLLLTRFMFVLASIFGECTVRCPSNFFSWCPGGVPVVSGCVPVVSRCGVAVVSQWCLGGVMVSSQWCPGGVPMVFCWSGRVSVVCRSCPSGVPVVLRGVPVVLQCVSGVPVVGAPVVSRWCRSGVSWCCSGVQWCPGCCSSGVLVVSRASWVLVMFHPVVSRSCPVFHAVVSRSRPPFRKICDCGAVGVLLVRWLVGLRWGGAGR